ncbi:MAG: Na+/H+ antiporter subunit E [Nitrospira sp.]|nr:Na+/H+ antiporter subunit E [Nitrospira sp.]
MNKVFPFPVLSLALAACWLTLTGLSPAQLVLALVLAVAIPHITAPFLGELPGIRSTGTALRLAGLVAWDIVVANITVARLVLGPVPRLRPGFVQMPLAITHPHAIALFASVVSIVPGSLSIAFSPDSRTLLLHVLHLEDEQHFVARIKERYERPIMDMLEC